MNGNDFFNKYLNEKLRSNPNLLAEAGVKLQSVAVEIEGGTGGQWTLAFDGNGGAAVQSGSQSKDCTIQMNEKTWEGLMAGTLNIPMAVVMRKIKIKGDTGLAAKVGMTLKKLNA